MKISNSVMLSKYEWEKKLSTAAAAVLSIASQCVKTELMQVLWKTFLRSKPCMDHLELAKKKCNFCSATDWPEWKKKQKYFQNAKNQSKTTTYFAKETEKAEKKDLFFAIRHS